MPRRVVVTGMGAVSSLGHSAAALWQGLATGMPGIGPLTRGEPARLRFRSAAEVRDFRTEDHFERKQAELLDRFAQFAVVAAREAVQGAGVVWTPELRARTAVVTGACTGGQDTMEAGFRALFLEQRRVSLLTVPRVMANAGASHITMELGVTGPAYTVSTACASASHAIGQGFWLVRSGGAELAVVGGSEAPLSLGNLKAWEALRVVSADTCRPFAKNRSGMVLGEGGAMLVLEPLESAQARGARICGEIVGFGMSADAQHLTNPSPEGAAAAMRRALEDAALRPEQVGYVNAHGTGTVANDAMEVQALRLVFGDQAGRLAISSTKSAHGHVLGASGAIEAVATVLALHHGVLPATLNFTEPDPDCDLDVIPNTPRRAQVEYALSNSFAFGGLNAVLAFRAWRQAPTPTVAALDPRPAWPRVP